MPEQPDEQPAQGQGGAAPDAPQDDAPRDDAKRSRDTGSATSTQPVPTRQPPCPLPQWKVLLHNDDVNTDVHVVETILLLTALSKQDAYTRMLEAHTKGVSLVLTTHRERAELYQQQFASRNLSVTIEPAE